MSGTTSVALIGYGPWGRNYHRTIDSLRDVRIHSVCRLHPEATAPGILERVLVTSDISEALDGADAAVVATPPGAHREAAIACLRAGVPVMLEKPVALTLEDADAIFGASEDAGIPVLIDHVHLFSPAFEALRSMTSAWDPFEIESEGGAPESGHGYSPLLDYGPHDLSMALALFGPPESWSVERVPSPSGELWRLTVASGRGKAVATVGTGFPAKKRRFEVRCGGRFAVYDDLARKKLSVDGRPMSFPDELPLKRAVLAFHRFVQSGVTDWRFDARLGWDVMRVLLEPSPVSP